MKLSHTDLLRFAYGEADELEQEILDNPEYLAVLEDIWSEELPHDLRTPLVRAVQFEMMASRTLGAVLDLGLAFGSALPHYLAASIDEPPDGAQDPPGD